MNATVGVTADYNPSYGLAVAEVMPLSICYIASMRKDAVIDVLQK